jgi:hypothetical protein
MYIDSFICNLNTYLEQLNNNNIHYVIAGDINININDSLVSNDYLYINNLQALKIKCHITHHYGTILSFNARPIDFHHNKQTKLEND